MNKLLAVFATIGLVAFAMPNGLAGHCAAYSTTTPELDTTGYGGDYYVDVHGAADGIWIYQESNGIPGLQRGDSQQDDTCHGQIEADTIIF